MKKCSGIFIYFFIVSVGVSHFYVANASTQERARSFWINTTPPAMESFGAANNPPYQRLDDIGALDIRQLGETLGGAPVPLQAVANNIQEMVEPGQPILQGVTNVIAVAGVPNGTSLYQQQLASQVLVSSNYPISNGLAMVSNVLGPVPGNPGILPAAQAILQGINPASPNALAGIAGAQAITGGNAPLVPALTTIQNDLQPGQDITSSVANAIAIAGGQGSLHAILSNILNVVNPAAPDIIQGVTGLSTILASPGNTLALQANNILSFINPAASGISTGLQALNSVLGGTENNLSANAKAIIDLISPGSTSDINTLITQVDNALGVAPAGSGTLNASQYLQQAIGSPDAVSGVTAIEAVIAPAGTQTPVIQTLQTIQAKLNQTVNPPPDLTTSVNSLEALINPYADLTSGAIANNNLVGGTADSTYQRLQDVLTRARAKGQFNTVDEVITAYLAT